MFSSLVKDRNNDRQFRLMFWSKWRSFRSRQRSGADGYCRSLDWSQKRACGQEIDKTAVPPADLPWEYRDNYVKSLTFGRFSPSLWGGSLAPQFACQLGIHFCCKRYFSRTTDLSPSLYQPHSSHLLLLIGVVSSNSLIWWTNVKGAGLAFRWEGLWKGNLCATIRFLPNSPTN